MRSDVRDIAEICEEAARRRPRRTCAEVCVRAELLHTAAAGLKIETKSFKICTSKLRLPTLKRKLLVGGPSESICREIIKHFG